MSRGGRGRGVKNPDAVNSQLDVGILVPAGTPKAIIDLLHRANTSSALAVSISSVADIRRHRERAAVHARFDAPSQWTTRCCADLGKVCRGSVGDRVGAPNRIELL
jgi:hypothetical protein